MTPVRFAKRIRKLGQGIETNTADAIRKTAVAFVTTVVPATPVDTGKARSNWLARLDRNATHIVQPIDISGAGAISKARLVIAEYRARQNRAIVISNNVPYIDVLNQGSSKQAPAAFIELAVLTASRVARNAKVVR